MAGLRRDGAGWRWRWGVPVGVAGPGIVTLSLKVTDKQTNRQTLTTKLRSGHALPGRHPRASAGMTGSAQVRVATASTSILPV